DFPGAPGRTVELACVHVDLDVRAVQILFVEGAQGRCPAGPDCLMVCALDRGRSCALKSSGLYGLVGHLHSASHDDEGHEHPERRNPDDCLDGHRSPLTGYVTRIHWVSLS